MCEIRFNISAKDGKLEGMVNTIPSNIRAEVIKEAIRYFLCHVRDNKVESAYIDSDILDGFKTNVQENVFTTQDIFRILESRQIVQPSNNFTNNLKDNLNNSANSNSNVKIAEDLKEDKSEIEDEFILDLSNDFEENQSTDLSINVDNFDDIDF